MLENPACERRELPTMTGRQSPAKDQYMKQCRLTSNRHCEEGTERTSWGFAVGVDRESTERQVDRAISLTSTGLRSNMLKSSV